MKLLNLNISKLIYHIQNYFIVNHQDNITFGYILETDNFEATVEVLDEIEGYPGLYDRILVKVLNLDLKEKQEVYFYTLNQLNEHDLFDINVNDIARYQESFD